MVVYPTAYMSIYVTNTGAKLVIISISLIPMDYRITVLIRTKAGGVMLKVSQWVWGKTVEPNKQSYRLNEALILPVG